MKTGTPDSKTALRADMRARRVEAHAQQRASAGARLAALAAEVAARAPAWPAVVSGFLPIGNEIDVEPLMQALAARGASLALPVIEKKAHPLQFRQWTPGAALETKAWGIREPGADAVIVEPDLLLVPLLAVDRAGYRLGYGGGFYDRTLARLRAMKPVVAIGVAYDAQLVDAVPRESYDERLDGLLTPSGFSLFDRHEV
ncbi:MAG: 5-formyltetrahydrofolate cyclo-ligase [Hyphomicrobiaceae bacterium]|nr:5-formyltetrahydrofolate cyclo-ligase [Hyphomicrobiaceae bacterium]